MNVSASGKKMSTEYPFSSYSSEYCLESYSEVREAECVADMVSDMSVSWIPDLTLIGMWPWTSLGLVCEMGTVVILFCTIIVQMICDYSVRCPALAWNTMGTRECLLPLWVLACTWHLHNKVAQSCPLHSQVQQRSWPVCENPRVNWLITLTEKYWEVTHGRTLLSLVGLQKVYSSEGVFPQWWELISKFLIASVIRTMIYKLPRFRWLDICRCLEPVFSQACRIESGLRLIQYFGENGGSVQRFWLIREAVPGIP